LPFTDAVEGDELVADEADDACDRDPAEVVDGLRRDEATDCLGGGDDRRQRDHQDDEDPGKVFGSPVAVRVPACGSPAGESERDEQRDGGQRVTEVVDGVGEQRNRSRRNDDRDLND
jgi:hypothetical protein